MDSPVMTQGRVSIAFVFFATLTVPAGRLAADANDRAVRVSLIAPLARFEGTRRGLLGSEFGWGRSYGLPAGAARLQIASVESEHWAAGATLTFERVAFESSAGRHASSALGVAPFVEWRARVTQRAGLFARASLGLLGNFWSTSGYESRWGQFSAELDLGVHAFATERASIDPFVFGETRWGVRGGFHSVALGLGVAISVWVPARRSSAGVGP